MRRSKDRDVGKIDAADGETEPRSREDCRSDGDGRSRRVGVPADLTHAACSADHFGGCSLASPTAGGQRLPALQKICRPPARISFSASLKYGVLSATSFPTCSAYSSQLFRISSSNNSFRLPSRSPSCRLPG